MGTRVHRSPNAAGVCARVLGRGINRPFAAAATGRGTVQDAPGVAPGHSHRPAVLLGEGHRGLSVLIGAPWSGHHPILVRRAGPAKRTEKQSKILLKMATARALVLCLVPEAP